PIVFLDSRTGERKGTAPLVFQGSDFVPTPDGRHFVIRGQYQRNRPASFWEKWLDEHWPELLHDMAWGVLVMETTTGRELFRGVNCGKTSATLSADGSTLVTSEALEDDVRVPCLIRVWDVHPT